MKINELIELVGEHYDDNFTDEYWNYTNERFDPNGGGDGLAKFVVIEINDTFEPDATTDEQLEEAIRVMQAARNQLNDLIAGLEQAAMRVARGEHALCV